MITLRFRSLGEDVVAVFFFEAFEMVGVSLAIHCSVLSSLIGAVAALQKGLDTGHEKGHDHAGHDHAGHVHEGYKSTQHRTTLFNKAAIGN